MQQMPAGDLPRSDLAEELPYLQQLDTTRAAAIALRDAGLRGLVRYATEKYRSTTSRSPVPGWSTNEPNHVATRFLRTAKQLAWSLGLLNEDAYDSFPPLAPMVDGLWDLRNKPRATEEDVKAFENHVTQAITTAFYPAGRERTPILEAAQYLRAVLGEPPKSFSFDLILPLYVIVRELYYAGSPEWALGGAKAGGRADDAGTSSAFVTHECARALRYIVLLVDGTADVVERLSKSATYIERITENQRSKRLQDSWCKREMLRVHMSLRTTIELSRGSMLLGLSVDTDPESCIVNAVREVKRFIQESIEHLEFGIACIRALRKGEEGMLTSGGDANAIRRRKKVFELEETPHRRALSALEEALDALKQGVHDVAGQPAHSKRLACAAELLHHASGSIRALLEPTEIFVSRLLFRWLFNLSNDLEWADYQEVAFAAATAAALSGKWQDRVFVAARDLLASRLDQRGRMPAGRPYHHASGGLHLHATTAQALGAFARLIRQVPGRLDADLPRRMVRFFEEQKCPVPDGVGWRRARTSPYEPPSVWVSCASVVSLHAIVRMLDQKINETALRHLRHKLSPELVERVPDIDDLMCSDLGLACSKSTPTPRSMITEHLERMRAHLMGPRTERAATREALCSMILFGPPGTGKTTLAASLAKTAGVTLVLVTPSELVIRGEDAVERQATSVMQTLCMLTNCVVLFDEFDSVLSSRHVAPGPPSGSLAFLTPNMLPKLTDLYDAASRNRLVYLLATNHVERMDRAAIRDGRFQIRQAVYPADIVSRACRVISQVSLWFVRNGGEFTDDLLDRCARVILETHMVPMSDLCRPGVLTAPRKKSPIWSYIFDGGEFPALLKPIPIKAWLAQSDGGSMGPDAELVMEQELTIKTVAAWDRALLSIQGEAGQTVRWADIERVFNDNRNRLGELAQLPQLAPF